MVTGIVHATDPDGDPLTYTGPTASTKGGAVIVNTDGTFTYAPTTQLRLNAFSTLEGAIDSFTVAVNDGLGGVLNVLVPVTVEPLGVAVIRTSDSPAVPGNPLGIPVIGTDGTSARTVYSGTGTAADPYRTTVIVVHPDGTVMISDPIEGQPQGSMVVDTKGNVYQTTETGDGVAQPYVTTVTVIHPDGDTTSTVIEEESVIGGAGDSAVAGVVVGPDGTAYQTTSFGTGGTNSPYGSTVTIIRPDGTVTSVPAGVFANSGVVIGTDGNVYQTADAAGNFGGTHLDGYTTVTVIHADGTATYVEIFGHGLAAGVVAIGGDGTVYQSTWSATGPSGQPYATTVTIIHPDGSSVTGPPIAGFPGSNIVAGADGLRRTHWHARWPYGYADPP